MNIIKKILKWLVGVFVALLLVDALLLASFAVFSSQYEKADAIIVMGAAINSPALYNRSLKALEIYEAGYASVIVLSGGRISDRDISEAAYMQRVILQNNNNDNYNNNAEKPKLILDEQSQNTYENIRNSKNLLPNAKSIIIVTDKFHLARSVITARALGFKQVYWSAPGGEHYKSSDLAYYYLRELAGMFAYLPKFLVVDKN